MTFLMENVRVSYYNGYVSKVYEHIIYGRTAESHRTYRCYIENCIVSLSKEIGGKRGWRNLNTQMRLLGKNHSHACKCKKVFISNARGKFILKITIE